MKVVDVKIKAVVKMNDGRWNEVEEVVTIPARAKALPFEALADKYQEYSILTAERGEEREIGIVISDEELLAIYMERKEEQEIYSEQEEEE